MKRLTPDRLKEIRKEFDPPLGFQGFFSRTMIYELLCEIDVLWAESGDSFNHLFKVTRERDSLKAELAKINDQ